MTTELTAEQKAEVDKYAMPMAAMMQSISASLASTMCSNAARIADAMIGQAIEQHKAACKAVSDANH